jgi:hypothetical protein
MKTIAKLGRKVKKKYPEYKDMSDEEVGRLVKEKYPGSYDDYMDAALTIQPSTNPQTREKELDSKGVDIEESIQNIRSGNFKTGWAFFNRIRAKRALSYAEVKAAENAIADQLIQSEIRVAQAKTVKRQSETVLHEMRMQEEMRDAMHALDLLKIRVEGTLISKAVEQGLTLEVHQALKLEGGRSEIHLNQQEKLSEIKINEHRQLSAIDVETEFNKVMSTLAAITRFKHLQYDAFDEVRGRLVTLLEEAHKVENSNMDVHLKAQIISPIQQAIDAYQEIFNAQKVRLMEAGNGQGVRPPDPIAKLIERSGSSDKTSK